MPRLKYRQQQRPTLQPLDSLSGYAYTEALPHQGTVAVVRRDDRGRLGVIFGRGLAAKGKLDGARAIPCVELVSEDPDLEGLDEEPSGGLVWEARAAAALARSGLALANIAQVLGLRSKADAQRRVMLSRRPARVLSALPASLLPTHLRYLGPLDDTAFEKWVREIADRKLSVGAVRRAVKAKSAPAPAADILAHANTLGQQFGTEVEISWPAEESARQVRLAWYTAEDLSGLLGNIAARGGQGITTTMGVKRWLVVQVRTVDELEAVFGS